jgi:hypothetical protein
VPGPASLSLEFGVDVIGVTPPTGPCGEPPAPAAGTGVVGIAGEVASWPAVCIVPEFVGDVPAGSPLWQALIERTAAITQHFFRIIRISIRSKAGSPACVTHR